MFLGETIKYVKVIIHTNSDNEPGIPYFTIITELFLYE